MSTGISPRAISCNTMAAIAALTLPLRPIGAKGVSSVRILSSCGYI